MIVSDSGFLVEQSEQKLINTRDYCRVVPGVKAECNLQKPDVRGAFCPEEKGLY